MSLLICVADNLKRIDQRGLATAGLADDGGTVGVDMNAVQAVERPPIEDLQLIDEVGPAVCFGFK